MKDQEEKKPFDAAEHVDLQLDCSTVITGKNMVATQLNRISKKD